MSGIKLYKRPLCWLSGLFVPFLFLAEPAWLRISGIGPCWAVLWLLPWALEVGVFSAVFSGFCLGLVLDGLSLGGATQIPALIILGWWWGHLGRSGPPIERTLNIGLLAWIGSLAVGLSIWLQVLIFNFHPPLNWLNGWGLQTLMAQSILTGLIAPMIGSWLLIFWRRVSLLGK